jgi:hypothetical protein
MLPPPKINILDKIGGFTAMTKGGTLYRGPSIAKKLLKKGSIGTLARFNERSFFQTNNHVTQATYDVPGYGYHAIIWFDNKTRRRIN